MVSSRVRRGLAWGLSVIAATAWAGNVWCQTDPFKSRDDGLQVGHFLLYPSLSMEFGRDDNVFYRSVELDPDSIVNSGVIVVRPRIMADLPIGGSRIRWVYVPQYRDYSSRGFQQSDRVSHFFDLDTVVRMGDSMELGLRDHLVKGTIELQEVDPGGEAIFGLVPFLAHEPELEIATRIGARQKVSVIPRYSSVSFQDAGAARFFSYDRRGLEARYTFQVSEGTEVSSFYDYELTHQSREQAFFGTVDVVERNAGFGLSRHLGSDIETLITVGYKTMRFAMGGGGNFGGVTANATASWRITDETVVDLSLSRQPYQSYFVNNNYYVNDRLHAGVRKQLGRVMFLDGSATVFRNLYASDLDVRVAPNTPPGEDADMNGYIDAYESLLPSQGVRRYDHGYNVDIGIGLVPQTHVRTFLGYNYEVRQSNIEQDAPDGPYDPFHYKVSRWILRLELGWM
jgi:hypothetical protein